jgi:hypothetical protein
MKNAVVVAAMIGVLALSAVHATAPVELTYGPGWVDAALAYGRTSQPAPYTVRAPFERGVPTALVYTPFIRVALLARQAENAGRELTSADVPASAREPVVYVRFYRLLPEDRTGGVEPVFGMVPTGDVAPDHHLVKAAWVREIEPSLLAADSSESHKEKFYPVAAFPLDQLRPGFDFVVYHKFKGADGSWYLPNLRGAMRQDELGAWR